MIVAVWLHDVVVMLCLLVQLHAMWIQLLPPGRHSQKDQGLVSNVAVEI
jgi:hypothetical protein